MAVAASICTGFAQAPTIHDYADAAACQMGGREPSYLPAAILPGGLRIPIYWQGGQVFWEPAKNPPDGTGQFVVEDPVDGFKRKPIAADFPEPGAAGPYTDPRQSNPNNGTGRNIRCDTFSYVNPSCTPDQFVREVYQGVCLAGANRGRICSAASEAEANGQCPGSTCGNLMQWHVLFRRSAAAANAADDPASWGETSLLYYKIVDAIGLKLDTFATVWLDGLGAGGKTAARDYANGFRAGPMPRPGGKRWDKRKEGIRAEKWFDAPATMVAGTCNACHATPFNGSDWLKYATDSSGGRLDLLSDQEKPWWFAGNEKAGFPDNGGGFPAQPGIFFSKAQSGGNDFTCTAGCHKQWMISSGGTPGGPGNFARYLTMVHDAHADNPFKALPSLEGGDEYRKIASSYRTDKPQTVFLNKNAKQTHVMPSPHNAMKVADWVASYREQYNQLACCGAGLEGMAMQPPNTDGAAFNCSAVTCANKVSQREVKAGLITPWMAARGKTPQTGPKANGTQFIAPPDSAASVSLALAACPAGLTPPNPGDRCFRLAWTDPTGSPFNAPKTFHYTRLPNRKVSDPDWPAADIQTTEYCGDGLPAELAVDGASSVFPKVRAAEIPVVVGDKWRYSYETFGILPKCEKMALRLCGGWCPQAIQLAGEGAPAGPNRMSTDLGRFLFLANDTLGDFSNAASVVRGGFRKNLISGRWIQQVTVTNTSQVAIPAPVSLVLKNLSANAKLFNKSGDIGTDPFINLMPAGDDYTLAPGKSISIYLEFENPTNQAITYTTQVLALTISADCK